MTTRPSSSAEVRRSSYKVAVGADEGWRRREDKMAEIRKSKREESLLKKRRLGLQQQQFSSSLPSSIEKEMESLPTLVEGIWSNEGSLQLKATMNLHELLSIETSPPIEEVIKLGVVPRFVEFLQREDSPQLQFQAAWAMTNIASENTLVVIEHGAVPIFVKLLGSPSDDVREQAVWALGNVAADSSECCGLVLSHGALNALLPLLNENSKPSMLRNATWTLSIFCRGEPLPVFEQVRPALPVLERLVRLDDEEVLEDACWALSYIFDGSKSNDKIQAEASVCKRLVELLRHRSPLVLIPALRTIGNIVTGDEAQTQCIIDNGALGCLLSMLTAHHPHDIKKEACRTISKIAAGNIKQKQAVIEAGLIGPLVDLFWTDEIDIKKEVTCAISNAVCNSSIPQTMYMVDQKCIELLCDLLDCNDQIIVMVCLKGVEKMLRSAEARKDCTNEVNTSLELVEAAGGLEKIKKLWHHDNIQISKLAVLIHKRYWQNIPIIGRLC